MLTKLTIRNFKQFDDVTIELDNPVVFVGPNNSGKTSALQALSLWELGVRHWHEKRASGSVPRKRSGVAINRMKLLSIPQSNSKLLWRNLGVRLVGKLNGRQNTQNIRIEIIVEGKSSNSPWKWGLEFDYGNEESIYCRPLQNETDGKDMPPEAVSVHCALLPPMSGLTSEEDKLTEGSVAVRIGEGRTAEVLRNLCYNLHEEDPQKWQELVSYIEDLFGAKLEKPFLVSERGSINMAYREGNDRKSKKLDLLASGRGMLQTMLILSYMYTNPGAILLLDEPDAHLEALRQRQMYGIINEVARSNNNQIIIASHSEVLLNEAASEDKVIAFIGAPHILGKRHELIKALSEFGYEEYLLAEQKGWVLYLEGPFDLKILQAFSKRLGNEAAVDALERPFVKYVRDKPAVANKHFYAMKEAKPDLEGVALFDRLNSESPQNISYRLLMWERCEIENYLCHAGTLEAWSQHFCSEHHGPLLFEIERRQGLAVMQKVVEEVTQAFRVLGKQSLWDKEIKASDDVLKPIFSKFHEELGVYNAMSKKCYHELVPHIPDEELDPEIARKLDAIVEIAKNARPGDG